MSQEVLKTYTQQTLNFGVEFLSRLSKVALPDDLTEMHKTLTGCFCELNKAWGKINKFKGRNKKGFQLDELRNQLKDLDVQHQSKLKNGTMSKSKSINDLDMMESSEDSESSISPRKTCGFEKDSTSPTSSPNVSPIVPPKMRKPRQQLKVDVTNPYDVFGSNYENCNKLTNSTTDSPFEKRKGFIAQSKGLTLPLSFGSSSAQCSVSEKQSEDDYLIIENEKLLPSISKFSQLNKTSNVIVNHWQLGERYCGISEGVLYIFYKFQDTFAEISMELPKMYLGKGQNGKSVLFQTREIIIEVVLANKEMQEKFYQAAFRAQNKYDKTPANPQLKNAPKIPRPYKQKEGGPMYINISTDIAHKIKRWRPIKCRPKGFSTTADENEEYVDMSSIEEYVDMSGQCCRVKTSY